MESKPLDCQRIPLFYLFKDFPEKFPEMVLMEWAKSQLNQMKGGSRDKTCSHFHISPKHLPPQMLEVIEENHIYINKAIESPSLNRKIRTFPIYPWTRQRGMYLSILLKYCCVCVCRRKEAKGGSLLRKYANELVHQAFKYGRGDRRKNNSRASL